MHEATWNACCILTRLAVHEAATGGRASSVTTPNQRQAAACPTQARPSVRSQS